MKKVQSILGSIFALFLGVTPAYAHVVVKPSEANVGAFQTFTVGVPNEKDVPTVGIRLVIPEGLNHVSPNVKPGWTIRILKSGEGEDAKVTEIIWTGGAIPVGQRDEFLFSAQVPTEKTTIQWKAYQTYQGGTVVSWDQSDDEESHSEENENKGPLSETTIINDLDEGNEAKETIPSRDTTREMSMAALALSVVALGLQFYYRQKKM